MRSMTAFAAVHQQDAGYHLSWELRSVNHRYLELSLRLPENLRFLETALRQCVRSYVQRGKLECQLKLTPLSTEQPRLQVHTGLMNALLKTADELALKHAVLNDLKVSDLLSWPGVLSVQDEDVSQLSQVIEQAFAKALSQLVAVRAEEGNRLKKYILSRLDELHHELARARAASTHLGRQSKDKLLSRFHALQLTVGEQRLEQELAFILSRLDVSEELDRLSIHIEEVRHACSNDEPQGRRLDFLMQELHREANTLGSKSESIEMTQHAVEMKVLIEQMREQIQNIE